MSKDIFEKLLRNAKDLPSDNNKSRTPQLNRGIDQIAKELENLTFKYNNEEVIGKRFLADSGIDAIELNANLKNLKTRFTFEKKEIIRNTDVEAYLNQAQEKYVTETVEESERNTRNLFLESMDDLLHSNWQKSKSKILEDWDIEQDNKLFGRKTQKLDIFKKQVPQYTSVIRELNSSRLINEKMNLVDKLKSLSSLSECTGTKKKSMEESWDIVSNLTKSEKLKEFDLSKDSKDSVKLVKMNRVLVQTSKVWLEKQYFSVIEKYLFENAVKAKVGGSPSIMHRLHSYVLLCYKDTLLQSNLEVKENTPIWLFLYILLRCGYQDLALKYVEENASKFSSAPEFLSCFKEYVTSANHRLSDENRVRIFDRYSAMEYVTHEDQYKILIYKMIGRCHLHVPCNQDIVNTIEDYIWYHLSLVSEQIYGERREVENYRLADLQKSIISVDSSLFDNNGINPWFYFNILLLTCQYERAVDYLYKHETFRLEAVHFGIVFAYHGLIHIPDNIYDNVLDLLVIDLDQHVYLNYCRLLNQYIQLFLSFKSSEALEYLSLFTLYPTDQMKEFCYEKICNFLVEYPDYKEILGAKRSEEGKLTKYKSIIGISDDVDYKEYIINPVADRFKYEERYQDAVAVYEAYDDYIQVFNVLNYQLGYVLNKNTIEMNPLEQEKLKTTNVQLIDYCSKVMNNFKKKFYVESDQQLMNSHFILLYFLQAIVEYENKKYEQALKLIKLTNLLPLNMSRDGVFQLVDQYNRIENETIRNIIPNMIVITAESLYELYKYYSQQKHLLNAGHQAIINECKANMKSVLLFIGMIASTIPSEVVRKINKLSSDMHC